MGGRRPVVFDLDGVLIDSERLAWEAWRRTLAPYGVTVEPEDVADLTGATEAAAHARFAERADLPDLPAFWGEIAATMYRLFDERLEAYEDAVDTVERLRRLGHKLAVASSSPRERLDRSLAAVGLADQFDFVVAGDEVRSAKPAPDMFLSAAAGLAADPADCIAVEDSPTGIRAAGAAGMWVVAVDRGMFTREDLGEADVIVPRLTPAVFAV